MAKYENPVKSKSPFFRDGKNMSSKRPKKGGPKRVKPKKEKTWGEAAKDFMLDLFD